MAGPGQRPPPQRLPQVGDRHQTHHPAAGEYHRGHLATERAAGEQQAGRVIRRSPLVRRNGQGHLIQPQPVPAARGDAGRLAGRHHPGAPQPGDYPAGSIRPPGPVTAWHP
jgi:hypothetical protein